MLEQYIHQNIPISAAMGIRVLEASNQKVVLAAPFAKNINHKKTVFGGSLHAVCALACWSIMHLNLKEIAPVDIVIAQSTVDFLVPVTEDFQAVCIRPEDDSWSRFLKTLNSKGKARIELDATIRQVDKKAVAFHAVFAALRTTRT